jgi:beta-phosphoglucomutase
LTPIERASVEAGLDTVIFDGEGVVIDTEGAWDLAQEEFLRRRGLSYDRARLKPLLTGRSSAEGIEVLRRTYRLEEDPAAMELERREIMKERLAEGVRYVEGFERFFERISGLYKTGLATAMDLDLFEIADACLNLRGLFSGNVFTLGYSRRAKPNPDLFLHAAREMGTPAPNCVVIEDSPYGIEAAKRAGMASIGLAGTYAEQLLQDADIVVKSFDEIDLDGLKRT